MGGVWIQLLETQGARAPAILVLRECIWNASVVSLILPPFHDTGSLGSPSRQIVYPPGFMVPPWVNASYFLSENREAELKPTPSSSLQFSFFSFFSYLFSFSKQSDIVSLCMGSIVGGSRVPRSCHSFFT